MNNNDLDIVYKIFIKNFKDKKIPLSEPILSKSDISYVSKAIKKKSVSSAFGEFTETFEKKIKSITKSKYVIALINGTCSLQIGLLASGLKKNQEVIIPALNFVASCNAVLYCGGVPHFVDVNSKDLGIDYKKLENYLSKKTIIYKNSCINRKTKRIIKFIMPTHVFGHIGNMQKLKKIAKKFKLKIVEDASEALGSFYKNKHAGTFGQVGVLSFNGNKIITTGTGGAILTNNKFLAKRIRHISTTARVRDSWEFYHDQIGYNYKMPNLNAALGISQINDLKNRIKKKRLLNKKYNQIFKKIKNFSVFKEPKDCKSNYWLQTIILNNKKTDDRKKIISYFRSKKIEIRPVWKILTKLNFLKKYPKMKIEEAASLEKRLLNIPSSPNL